MSEKSAYVHRHMVQFYETDLMRIVHHSNYLRIYEESRVGWAHARGLLDYQSIESAFQLAVVETGVRHIKPAQFGDQLEIHVMAKIEGARMIFAYRMYCQNKHHQLISTAKTVHAALDTNLKLIRPPKALKDVFEKEAEKYPWIETWLSNL